MDGAKDCSRSIVLVPTVYIANVNNIKIRGSQILAGNSIDLNVNTFTNSGTVNAGNNLAINSTNIIVNISGEISSSNSLSLKAKNDIKNTSGIIKSGNINLTSTDGSIINETFTKKREFGNENNKIVRTTIGNTAGIESTNSLKLNAKKEILIKGANLKGKNIELNANSLKITTIVDEKAFNAGTSKNYIKTNSKTHLASNIDATNLTINTKGTATIEGSKINASNDLIVNADSINILSVANENYKQTKSSSSGFLSKSSTTTTDYSLTNKGDLFKVKNQQEFNNGTTNGDTLVADLAGSDFTKIKNFTKENTQKTTKESLEKKYVSDLGDRVVDTAAQVYEGVKNLP